MGMLRRGSIEAILSRWAEMCLGCYTTGIVEKKSIILHSKLKKIYIKYNFTDPKCNFYPVLVQGYLSVLIHSKIHYVSFSNFLNF